MPFKVFIHVVLSVGWEVAPADRSQMHRVLCIPNRLLPSPNACVSFLGRLPLATGDVLGV